MFNRSEILRKAWADYRRDQFRGWGVRRGEAFNRKHFAYCLRMAWGVAKEEASVAVALAERRHELIREAGMLNNHPEMVNVDHVSIMGMMDTAECERHVAKLRQMTKPAPSPAVAARVEEVRGAILDLEMGNFIDWRRHGALHAELASLAA